jgi:hypothetical protein
MADRRTRTWSRRARLALEVAAARGTNVERALEALEDLECRSPACRLDDETRDECVARKVPEILEEMDVDRDQAVAIAFDMCATPCSEGRKREGKMPATATRKRARRPRPADLIERVRKNQPWRVRRAPNGQEFLVGGDEIIEARKNVEGRRKTVLTRDAVRARMKALGMVYKAGDERRVIDYTASTERVDHHGDIIRLRGWDFSIFRRNPVILNNHGYDGLPIGRGLDFAIEPMPGQPKGRGRDSGPERKRLRISVLFMDAATSPEAHGIYKMVDGGWLLGGSVGFIPRGIEELGSEERERLGMDDWGAIYDNQSLLEFSVATIPANPDALAEQRSFVEAVERGLDSGGFEVSEIEPLVHACYRLAPTRTLHDLTRALSRKVFLIDIADGWSYRVRDPGDFADSEAVGELRQWATDASGRPIFVLQGPLADEEEPADDEEETPEEQAPDEEEPSEESKTLTSKERVLFAKWAKTQKRFLTPEDLEHPEDFDLSAFRQWMGEQLAKQDDEEDEEKQDEEDEEKQDEEEDEEEEPDKEPSAAEDEEDDEQKQSPEFAVQSVRFFLDDGWALEDVNEYVEANEPDLLRAQPVLDEMDEDDPEEEEQVDGDDDDDEETDGGNTNEPGRSVHARAGEVVVVTRQAATVRLQLRVTDGGAFRRGLESQIQELREQVEELTAAASARRPAQRLAEPELGRELEPEEEGELGGSREFYGQLVDVRDITRRVSSRISRTGGNGR